MKRIYNIILSICVVILVYLCYTSIMRPINFDKVRTLRERVVLERMRNICKAEIAYRTWHNGRYTHNLDSLIAFTKSTASPQSDSLKYIPYSNKKPFIIIIIDKRDSSGAPIYSFEVRAPYSAYLQGTNKEEIANIAETAKQSKRYQGLSMNPLNVFKR